MEEAVTLYIDGYVIEALDIREPTVAGMEHDDCFAERDGCRSHIEEMLAHGIHLLPTLGCYRHLCETVLR